MEPIALLSEGPRVPMVVLLRTPSAKTQFWYDADKPVPKKLTALDQGVGGL